MFGSIGVIVISQCRIEMILNYQIKDRHVLRGRQKCLMK